jgi:hypothetical protein
MLFRVELSLLARTSAVVWRHCVPVTILASAMLSLAAMAQPAATPVPQYSAAPVVVATSTWSSLTKSQQLALVPLAKSWDGLSEGQKRKWIAIAKTYPSLGATEQETLHSRMVEWTGLSPRDRELARLNFAQTKSVDKADRAANWEAYQALSPEDRKKLADGANGKPVGAAVAIKPVAADKLAAVPVTRHTPEQERAAVASQKPLNRNTLLPQNGTPKRLNASDSATLSTPSKP